jgi:pimeloyl-ACP methyl ester carboxylesterase
MCTGCGLIVKTIPSGEIPGSHVYDHFVDLGGVRYHYTEYPADGPDIVLVHGFASSTYTWEAVVPYLHERGYHVFALDMKGFGWSDKPDDAFYDPVSLMEEVDAWMEALGLTQVVFAGNSLGGAVAVLMALEHPARISKLVLIDAAGYPMQRPMVIRLAHLPLAGGVMKLFFGPWLVRWNLKEVFSDDVCVTDEKVKAYYDRLRTENALDAQIAVARSLKLDQLEQYIERIPDITTDTLIIWGKDDRWIPLDIGRRFKNDIAGSTLTVIPECGHMPQEEQPERTAQLIIDFIEDTHHGGGAK